MPPFFTVMITETAGELGVFTYGTLDLFRGGNPRLLERLPALDELIFEPGENRATHIVAGFCADRPATSSS
jgi:hypothetical protein